MTIHAKALCALLPLALASWLSGCGRATSLESSGFGSAVCGQITSLATGAPVEGAIIRLKSGAATASDASGRFQLATPPGLVELSVEAEGHLAVRRSAISVGLSRCAAVDMALWPETSDERLEDHLLEQRRLEIPPAEGDLRPQARELLQRLEAADSSPTLHDLLPQVEILPLVPAPAAEPAEEGVLQASLAAVPSTIRVWRRRVDGSTASCTGRVDVIPFEDYVKGVLPHEWVASWDMKSVELGAVAIRTYAWWWVAARGASTSVRTSTAPPTRRSTRTRRSPGPTRRWTPPPGWRW